MIDSSPDATSTGLSRPARVAMWLSIPLLTGILALIGFLYFHLLPELDTYRPRIEAAASHALGTRLTLEHVTGRWAGGRPHLEIREAVLHDRHNRPALVLRRVSGSLSWWSLLRGEVRFAGLLVEQPRLDLLRDHAGHLFVAGIPVSGEGESGFARWLLAQREITIRDAVVTWRDEKLAVPPLAITQVNLRLENFASRHSFTLTGVPPATLAKPFAAQGRLIGRDPGQPGTWSGQVGITLAGADLAVLRTWLPQGIGLRDGRGSLAASVEFEHGAVSALSSRLELSGVRARLTRDLPELVLASLRGEVSLAHAPREDTWSARQLEFQIANGQRLRGLDLSLQRKRFGDNWRYRLEASNLDLAPVAQLTHALPLPEKLRVAVHSHGPRGLVSRLDVGWEQSISGTPLDNPYLKAEARFTGLGFEAYESIPGLLGVSGNLHMDRDQGSLTLRGRGVSLDLPDILRQRLVALDSLDARLRWTSTNGGLRLGLDEIRLSNPDLEGELSGSYQVISGRPGVIDLSGRFTRADGTQAWRYLPWRVSKDTRDWLRRSISVAHSEDVRLRIRGDMTHYPFRNDRHGLFQVWVKLEGADLRFAEQWPMLRDIDGELEFRGAAMHVRARRGSMLGIELAPVTATIPELFGGLEQLYIQGRAQGPAQDFVRFCNASPVGERIGGLTRGMRASGNLGLKLSLHVPLHHASDTHVQGELAFAGNRVDGLAEAPPIENLSGMLAFTEDLVSARQLTARVLGGPATCRIATRGGAAVIQARGNLAAGALREWLQHPIARKVEGTTSWEGEFTLRGQSADFRVQSNLAGLALALPEPLVKRADQSLAASYSRRTLPDGKRITEFDLDQRLGGQLETRPDGSLSRGAIRLGSGPGSSATGLPAGGLRVAGHLAALDVDAWRGVLSSEGTQGDLPPIQEAALEIDALRLAGRSFHGLNASLSTRGPLWLARLRGAELDGSLTVNHVDTDAPVIARFARLTIPEPQAAAQPPTSSRREPLRPMDVRVDELTLFGLPLGRLDLRTHRAGADTVVDTLTLEQPDARFEAHGAAQSGARGTRLATRLEVDDLGALLDRLGKPNLMRKGSSTLSGDMNWNGDLLDFGLASLSGTVRLEAARGEFLKADPGIAKLLGLISLQSLQRRLSLDFRDVFGQGFAFDTISGTIRMNRGVLYSNDFRMAGPAARVEMSGLVNLHDESAKLRLKVLPKLGEGVAIAGAVLGGPAVGLGALLAQKVLKDPFENATALEYMVEGPWGEPQLTRLSKPKRSAPSTPSTDSE